MIGNFYSRNLFPAENDIYCLPQDATKPSMAVIPLELIWKILELLPEVQLVNSSMVCRHFCVAADGILRKRSGLPCSFSELFTAHLKTPQMYIPLRFANFSPDYHKEAYTALTSYKSQSIEDVCYLETFLQHLEVSSDPDTSALETGVRKKIVEDIQAFFNQPQVVGEEDRFPTQIQRWAINVTKAPILKADRIQQVVAVVLASLEYRVGTEEQRNRFKASVSLLFQTDCNMFLAAYFNRGSAPLLNLTIEKNIWKNTFFLTYS